MFLWDKISTIKFGMHLFSRNVAIISALIAATSKKFKSYRGYCRNCCSVVWLSSGEGSNEHSVMGNSEHQVKPLSTEQVTVHIILRFFPHPAEVGVTLYEALVSKLY